MWDDETWGFVMFCFWVGIATCIAAPLTAIGYGIYRLVGWLW